MPINVGEAAPSLLRILAGSVQIDAIRAPLLHFGDNRSRNHVARLKRICKGRAAIVDQFGAKAAQGLRDHRASSDEIA